MSASNNKFITLAVAAAVTTVGIYYFLLRKKNSSNKKQSSTSSSSSSQEGTIDTTSSPSFLSPSSSPKIVEMWIFPIAGCRGYRIDGKSANKTVRLLEGGLEFDREFALIIPAQSEAASASDDSSKGTTSSSAAVEEKTWKKLSTLPIQNQIFTEIVTICQETQRTVLRVEYRPASKSQKADTSSSSSSASSSSSSSTTIPVLMIPLRNEGSPLSPQKLISIERYGTGGSAVDCGDEAAAWFRQVFTAGIANNTDLSENERDSFALHSLGEVRLCRVAKLRQIDRKSSHQGSGAIVGDNVRFQAFGGLHIISKESITWLQRNLPPNTFEADTAHSKRPMIITAERFRANLVVSGVKFPQEEQWKKVQIGSSASLHFAKHTDRCEVPTMDPITGKRHPAMQPTNTLKKLRGAKHPWQIARYERFQKNPSEFDDEIVKAPAVKGMFGIEMFQDRSEAETTEEEVVILSIGDEITVKETFEKGLEFIAEQ